MIKLDAIIKPFRFGAVKESLQALGMRGMTVTEVRGFGRQKGHAGLHRGAGYSLGLAPKAKLEVVVAISAKARTGKIGDGEFFARPQREVVRSRTGETGAGVI